MVRNDIRLAAKIIQNLDARLDLWTQEDGVQPQVGPGQAFAVASRNPVIKKNPSLRAYFP